MDLRAIEAGQKHTLVIRHFDALREGESFLIINDHDPKVIYFELLALRGNSFTWVYTEEGPLTWKVLIEKPATEAEPTIGELVTADIRSADVFKKYGIDFLLWGKEIIKTGMCRKRNRSGHFAEGAEGSRRR